MKVFGIAGFKNAGKTTLVVELIGELRRRGLRVGTVKHAHHDFDIDHPGKDSYQHRAAGAVEVIVASARRWAHVRELNDHPEPPLHELLTHFGELDLVLVEGYKRGGHRKLELRRAGNDAPELAADDATICAIVSDGPVENAAVPVINRADIQAIAELVLAEAESV